MRYALTAILAFGLVAGVVGQASAHAGEQILSIYELPTEDLPDLRDGTLEDWEEVLGDAYLTHDDFTAMEVGSGDPIDPSDLALKIYMAWNSMDQRLYMAWERVDDEYVNTYEGGDVFDTWMQDGVEFYVDGDHSGGPYYTGWTDSPDAEEVKSRVGRQAQSYYGIGSAPDGVFLGINNAGKDWVVSPPWGDGYGTNTGTAPTTSIIEVAVTVWDDLDWRGPELSTPSPLFAGKIMGFDLLVEDHEPTPASYSGFYGVAGVTGGYGTADKLIHAELVPCVGGDCGETPTAVSAGTWGRIKASFQVD